MANIKSLADISAKWVEVTPGRATHYEKGVRAPRADWAQAAAAAEDAYQGGVQAAMARKGYSAGVRKAGTDKWQRKTLALGPARWPQGVRAAGEDFSSGFAPYHRVIEATTLPPRGAVGSPQNIDRVAAIATALHNAKVRTGGGS